MPNLRHLWITGSQAMEVEMAFKNNKNISYLNITHLHFLLPIETWEPYRYSSFIRLIHNLQVLQISNQPELQNVIDLPLFFMLLRDNPIAAISLRRFQSYRTKRYTEGLNLTSILSTSFNETLEYLDLSGNSLQFLIVNFIEIAPKLKVLDLSENLLTTDGFTQFDAPFYTFGLYEPFFLHPSLEVMDIGRQHVPETSISRYSDDIFTSDIQSKHRRSTSSFYSLIWDTILERQGATSCLNGSINDLATNRSVSAQFYNCYKRFVFAPSDHYQIPAEIMPLLDFDFSCVNLIRYPVAPHFHDIRMNEYSHIQSYINRGSNSKENICLASNELYSMDLANNKLESGMVKKLTEIIQGMDKLRHLDISKTDFYEITK